MGPFEMVVAIIAIVVIGKVIRDRTRDRRVLPAPETEALRADVARLKERVEVLERLATDRSNRLADEIDRL